MLKELKDILELKDIKLIYGEGGSGKTTICLEMTSKIIKEKKKVVYLDSGENFSLERFNQISNNENLDSLFLLKIKNFSDQHKKIEKLKELRKIDSIIIDSITKHYRRLYSKKPDLAKAMLGKQIKTLKSIKANIIITSEVYSTMNKNISPLGNEILITNSKKIIKLIREPRRLIFIKPKQPSIYFKIINGGITQI